MTPDGWQECRLRELEGAGRVELGRGRVISKEAISEHPGDYPVYSSSVRNGGLFGRYGLYDFDEELISWSVDGGGHFFYRPRHRFSVTNVSGFMRVRDEGICARFLHYQLAKRHSELIFDYTHKAHPSVIRDLYVLALPPLGEQRKIAAILSSVDDSIEAARAVIDQLQVVKRAMMAELLARGLPGRHTRFKQTEIGEVPEEWDVVPLDSLIAAGRPICYGVLKPGPHVPGGVPVVRITDYKGDRLDVALVQRSSAAIVVPFMRSTLRTGDLLISIRGTAGRVCVIPQDIDGGNISRDSARISLADIDLQSFVYCYLRSSVFQRFVFDEMRGMAVQGINIQDLRRLPVPVPSRGERQMICDTLLAIDAILLSNQDEVKGLLRTKSALTSVLLTGELRVTPDEAAA
jgi:type I restriction enzyme S subunit